MIKANFNAYANYVTDSLYQWDINQILAINGLNLNTIPEIHFSNAKMNGAIVRQAEKDGSIYKVKIPNSLLQEALTIKCHVGIYENNTFKVIEKIEIPIIAKKRPLDYVFEDNAEEIYSFEALKNDIANRVTNSQFESNNTTLNARIDNIIAHNNDTDGNSELIDVRVDVNGTKHSSAGEAIREQFKALAFGTNVEWINGNFEIKTNLYGKTASIKNLTPYPAYLIKNINGRHHQIQVAGNVECSVTDFTMLNKWTLFYYDGGLISFSIVNLTNTIDIIPYFNATNQVPLMLLYNDNPVWWANCWGLTYNGNVCYGNPDRTANFITDSIEQAIEKQKKKSVNILVIGDSYSHGGKWLYQLSRMIEIDNLVNLGTSSATFKDKYADRETYPYNDRPIGNDTRGGNVNTFASQIKKLKRLMAGTDLDAGENQIYTSENDYPNIIFIQGGANDGIDTEEQVSSYADQFYNKVSAYVKTSDDATPTLQYVQIKPDIESVNRLSFAGSARYLYEELHDLFPDAIIFFVTPCSLSYLNGNNQVTSIEKSDQIKMAARYLACPVIDWTEIGGINYIDIEPLGNGTQDNPYMTRNSNSEYTTDNLHPNDAGAYKLALAVYSKIESYLDVIGH